MNWEKCTGVNKKLELSTNFCTLHHVRFPGNSLFISEHTHSKVNKTFLELSLNIYQSKKMFKTQAVAKNKIFNAQHITTVTQTVSN